MGFSPKIEKKVKMSDHLKSFITTIYCFESCLKKFWAKGKMSN